MKKDKELVNNYFNEKDNLNTKGNLKLYNSNII